VSRDDELAKTRDILAERERVRAILAPTGADLEKLLVELHTQSARAQKVARRQQAKLRAEINRRLEEGETLVIHGTEVVVEKVTTREMIGAMEAENNSVKVEAMAQRSYDVHRMSQHVAAPQAGSIESFIDRLEAEEQTEGVDSDTIPDW
jgi:ABC-type protease/lipase transport system fused ATPase/permease subunit